MDQFHCPRAHGQLKDHVEIWRLPDKHIHRTPFQCVAEVSVRVMRTTIKYLCTLPLPLLFLLNGCAGNIGAGVPFGAALASCSTEANADHMVPDKQLLPSSGWKYRISGVSVSGPTESTIPPPILAATFRQALERALKQTELSESNALLHGKDYVLEADIVSQTRHGTFSTTTLELVISYSLISKLDPGKRTWNGTITTKGQIDDWKIDACRRLRNLQEELSRQNIRRLFSDLLMRNQ